MSFYGPVKKSECDFKIGDEVFVFKGRKVAIGTKGKVFWIGNPFLKGTSRFALTSYPIGLRDCTGQVHWTYDQNVKSADIDNGEGAKC